MSDLYKEIAAEVFNIPIKQVTNEQRSYIKKFVHIHMYGTPIYTCDSSLAKK